MSVSRKDFEAVAKTIKAELIRHTDLSDFARKNGFDANADREEAARVAVVDLAYTMAGTFETLSPTFQRRIFLIACGVVVPAHPTTGWAKPQL